MGGTFDPIHHGHLVAASEVADRFDLDEVVFVPTGQPWQKSEREVSRAEDRYLMTVVATASNPRSGADALAQILSWRDVDEVFRYAHFIGVTRPGYELGDDHLPHGVVSLVEVPAMAISSTDCRRRVGEGRPVWYLVPDGVVQYISKAGLYR
jgi:nicotinate-nucleotide adenylyltransferase